MRFPVSTRHITFTGLLLACACSSIDVVRVRSDDYTTKGFRFYLPRPYVVVKKSFPVGGESVFVRGKLEGERITEIDTTGVPEPIALYLGSSGGKGSVAIDQLTWRVRPETAPAGTAGDDEHAGGAAVGDTAITLISPAPWLAKSKVAPETLQSAENAYMVTLIVDKDIIQTVDGEIEVGVVPLAGDGTPDVASFTACVKTTNPTFDKTKDLTYVAAGLRKDTKGGPLFKVAARFKGSLASAPTDTKSFLSVAPNVALTIVSSAPAPQKQENESEKKVEVKSPSTSKGSISGDPATPVVNPVNEYFDLMYLPDFSEQYAVELTAGIGEATLDLGLENGWLVEKASVSISNKELGTFIFQQIDRFTSVAADVLRLDAGLIAKPLDAGDVEQSAETRTVGGQPEKWVLLKIAYSLQALPGVYPLLKPGEVSAKPCGAATYVHTPLPPFTVIAYNVRRDVVIELVVPAAKPAAPSNEPSPSATTQLNDADKAKVVAGLNNYDAGLTGATKGVFFRLAGKVSQVSKQTSDTTATLVVRTAGAAQADLDAAKSHLGNETATIALLRAIKDAGVVSDGLRFIQD